MSKSRTKKPNGLSWRFVVLVAVATLGVFWVGHIWRGDPSADQVAWRGSYEAALSEAETSGKPMLVVFSADWCGPCKQMKAWVFSDESVAKTIESGFVPLRVDLTNDEGQDQHLAYQYGVTGIPALLVLNIEGQAVSQVSGYHSKAEFLSWLDEAERRHGQLAAEDLSLPADAAYAGGGGLE